MEELITTIKNQINNDTRTSEEIYSYIKQLGAYMLTTNTLSECNVTSFCSSLLRLYLNLKNNKA